LAAREAVKSFEAKCQKTISRHLPQYEKTIGLTAPNREFRSKLTDAIIACAFQHMLTPFLRRPSAWRKDLAQASKEARTAQNSLQKLADILDNLPHALSDRLSRSMERDISWLNQVSVLTGRLSKALKLDRGGAPKTYAFKVLANGLADAYEIATGRDARITWNDYGRKQKYKGKFLEFVEAVLPLAAELANMPQLPLRVPVGKYALGKSLSTLTTARKKKTSAGPM
jgi:hypothetical protein